MRAIAILGLASVVARGLAAQVTSDAPAGRPQAVIDLTTTDGTRLVDGQWRYHDAEIVEVDHRSVGADLRPSGPPNRTHDITPKAGGVEFDDSGWEAFDGPDLIRRRTNGRLAFGWYRINLTVPAAIGRFATSGTTAVFEITVDDYAEIWVNGRLAPVLGQTGGQLIKGWNAPNRVVVGRNVRPGERIQLAIFGANGPLSDPPPNYVWVRSATLDFYDQGALIQPPSDPARVGRLDPAIDAIVPRSATIEKLAGGFEFLEGPVWVEEGGYLLFSDPNANTIYRWTPDGQVSIWRAKSGYTGPNLADYHQPGSNGLTLDAMGRVTIDQHGNRRVIRLERNGSVTVLADRYRGMRFNSPNDLVYRSDGALYFTDPPFGLPKGFADPAKETPFSGVYRVKDGGVTLLTEGLTGPNGIAFSPDEKYLYVDNWDPKRKVIMRYEVTDDGIRNGSVFFDITGTVPGDDAWDGIKVDRQGNLFAAGPAGIYVLSPEGKHLGTIAMPEHVANFAWGDADYRSLYITASTGLYRIRLSTTGAKAATRLVDENR